MFWLFKVLVIYMQIRVLVSSYLFLSGFGHFYYFFAKADYSIHRFCVVSMWVQLNKLCINRNYKDSMSESIERGSYKNIQ